MKVTDFTRKVLRYRRFARQAREDGFQAVCESGHPLGSMMRGGLYRHTIVDSRIAPDGREIWIKLEDTGYGLHAEKR